MGTHAALPKVAISREGVCERCAPGEVNLLEEIVDRMDLLRRDRRDIWYDRTSTKSPLAWEVAVAAGWASEFFFGGAEPCPPAASRLTRDCSGQGAESRRGRCRASAPEDLADAGHDTAAVDPVALEELPGWATSWNFAHG